MMSSDSDDGNFTFVYRSNENIATVWKGQPVPKKAVNYLPYISVCYIAIAIIVFQDVSIASY